MDYNREQLNEFRESRLEIINDETKEPEERKQAFREYESATKMDIEYAKIESEKAERQQARELEEIRSEANRKAKRTETVVQLIIGVAVPVGLEILRESFLSREIRNANNFETHGCYTNSSSRGLISSLFKFRW